ncbi:MAG: NAD(P)H-hydrate dehydratase [Pirellulales bacterium]|nr:NAD(P)H-hydrate dehydratase [Pirellulales bacterium]
MSTLHNHSHEPLPVLPPRPPESHKGDFGRALLVGGSRGMSGAIAMAGLAALRSGAGLVTLAVPSSIQHVVASFSPCYMTHGFAELAADENVEHVSALVAELQDAADNATAMALGPGLGRGPAVGKFACQIYQQIDRPMVVDADALFALASNAGELSSTALPRILTPHPGEFKLLAEAFLGKRPTSLESQIERVSAAAQLAQQLHSGNGVVVLKGHETVVTDGQRFSINLTGNPGLATGGTGDVLTGIITALLCQGLKPFDAARLGSHIHGTAGDLAAETLGQVPLIATDLIDYLPAAFQELRPRATEVD